MNAWTSPTVLENGIERAGFSWVRSNSTQDTAIRSSAIDVRM